MNYIKGAFWLFLASIIGITNDVCMKISTLAHYDVAFWRFATASLVLLPFVLYYKPEFNKKTLVNHGIRALIFGVGMFFYISSLQNLPLVLVNAINFSVPLWVVIMACIFLKEKWNGRLLSTSLGIIGVLIMLIPIFESASPIWSLILLMAAMGFAILDVFNKYLLNSKESILMMLFGSSIGITMLYLPFISWELPKEPLLFLWLGIGANLLLYCYLKAFDSCDIGSIQALKYIEFPIVFWVGNSFFKESITWHVFLGIFVLLCGIGLNMRKELKV